MSETVYIAGESAHEAEEIVGKERLFRAGSAWSGGRMRPVGTVSPRGTALLAGARRIVIWIDDCLEDQLKLARVPSLLRATGASPEQVELIQFPDNELSRPDGPVTPPAPVPLSPAHLAELASAWDALLAPEPDALVALISHDEPLPVFKRTLRALLLRYPEEPSGLNRAELKILDMARGGEVRAARIIGEVLGSLFRGQDLNSDTWVYERLLRLGDPSLPQPALELTGSPEAYRYVTARLTPFGERVLAGQASFLDANGIDEVIGGVHLDSRAGRVWFHDGGRLVRRR